MAAIGESIVSVRFFGDHLDPDEVTRLLGCEPSKRYRRGDLISADREIRRRFGAWIVEAESHSPEAIDEQLASIFARTTQDLNAWRELVARYDADVFCGLFMQETNEGFSLSVQTLRNLTERGLEIDFDVYTPTEDADPHAEETRQDTPSSSE